MAVTKSLRKPSLANIDSPLYCKAFSFFTFGTNARLASGIMLLLLSFAAVGCGTTEESFYSADEQARKLAIGHSVLLIPVAADAISLDPSLDTACFPGTSQRLSIVSLIDSLNFGLLIEGFTKFNSMQPGKISTAYTMPFSYALHNTNLKYIVQQTGDDTTTYYFTLPSELFLRTHTYKPEVICEVSKITFSRGTSTEGYYKDGIFHGGETAVLKATFEFVFFDYVTQQCISYGNTYATVPIITSLSGTEWHLLYQQIYRKLFSHSPWAIPQS